MAKDPATISPQSTHAAASHFIISSLVMTLRLKIENIWALIYPDDLPLIFIVFR
jgi:hypothetical protein